MTIQAKGLLFDLDGTLIDSLPAVDRAWRGFAVRHGLSPEDVLARIHGRRSIDSIRALVPHVDPDAEDAWIRNVEATDTAGVLALPGALALLETLPKDRWCVVTSGTSDVARARMAAVGLPLPKFAVYGEDVKRGKPDPEPFATGARLLGLDPVDCVGFEDTDAGLASIVAAGARPIAVGRGTMMDLSEVRARVVADGLEIDVPHGALVDFEAAALNS